MSLGLQHVFARLETYCSIYNLKVNSNKLNILVFRKGGKVKIGDKWWYIGETIEIVTRYTYLGIELTMSREVAKLAINSAWGKL